MNLYELSKDYLAIFEKLENATEEERPALLVELTNSKEALSLKLNACWRRIKNLEATAKAMKDEIATLQQRKRLTENKIEATRKWVQYCLPEGQNYDNGIEKFTWRESERTVPSEDFNKIPFEFMRVKMEPDLEKIEKHLESLQAGEVCEFARKVKRINLIVGGKCSTLKDSEKKAD